MSWWIDGRYSILDGARWLVLLRLRASGRLYDVLHCPFDSGWEREVRGKSGYVRMGRNVMIDEHEDSAWWSEVMVYFVFDG
jgi:hypothetical protein